MGYLVGDYQNAFLAGRSISDNILLAHEAIHKVNTHKHGKFGKVAFKADMSKAFDRVRWDFLQAVLLTFGFPSRLVNLIMNCVTTVSYEILLNGAPLHPFKPQCGLRQGDPLSPYLFILCMEVLSCNIESAQREGKLQGFRLCRGVSLLTHLFFADDSVFFFHNKGMAVRHLKRLLVNYCEASGQVINEDKSGIIFSPNTNLRKVRFCLKSLNIKHNIGFGKYLGLPTEFQQSKKEIFMGLVESVIKRISSWNGIFLSPAGRLTLISSVLSNLSIFFLSAFKIPVSVTKKINALLSQFWWAGSKTGKCLHWCSRNFTSLPKCEGGLGIRNVACLNQALLTKHVWRLVSNETSLFCSVFREKIMGPLGLENHSWICSKNSFSWGARSIAHGLKLIKEHIGWKPGIDSNLNVWDRKWVNGRTPEPKDCLLEEGFIFLKDLHVKDICINNGGWNEDLINLLFAEESVNHILAIPLHSSQPRDEIFLPFTSSGIYTVKSGYGILFRDYFNEHGSRKDKARLHANWKLFCGKKLWNLPGPQTWKILLWKIFASSLPIGSEFVKRDMTWASSCALCNNADGETRYEGFLRGRAESPLQAEALGLKEAISWARQAGVLHIEVSSDCLSLLTQWMGKQAKHHHIRNILQDITLLSSVFHCLCFSYVRRDCNFRAHALAQQAMSLH
ncbi:uncharacterized protein LOC141601837 [Silene latifolia]|uniref:uncharacterized protein LOC141601837 n=1 Tax=Silene latifolia TaxID=37657 RepID=UPI003D771880